MSKQSESIIEQIEASANGAEPEAKGPQPVSFHPAFLAQVRAIQADLNSRLICYFYGAGIDPATAHIQHDLNAGTWTLLDGPPEG